MQIIERRRQGSITPKQQCTSSTIKCYGRGGKFKRHPVDAFVTVIPCENGKVKREIVCPMKNVCKSIGIFGIRTGWCELEM